MAEEKGTLHQRQKYTDETIRHLDDTEHIRTRPGMYIGRLGDGSHAEDGIYVLLKETIDNSIDEFNEGFGKKIEVDITPAGAASIRDYGRGIPLRSRRGSEGSERPEPEVCGTRLPRRRDARGYV